VAKIQFRPGVLLDSTIIAAMGSYVASEWVRFRKVAGEDIALPESIPGWETLGVPALGGIARGAHAWSDLNGSPLFATATHDKVWSLVGGELLDITPAWGEFWLTDPLSTVSGSPTVTVRFNVYDADSNTSTVAPHGLIPGDVVTLSHVDAIGGITPAGTYTIQAVPTLTTFTITHGSNAGSTATMSGATKVWLSVAFRAGLVDGTGGNGYGTGAYDVGPYGLPTTGEYEARVTSFDNLGDRLYFVPRAGPLFGYQPRDSYPELIVNNDFAAAAGWALGTGWTITGGQLVATAGTGSNASQSIVDRSEAGAVYRVSVQLVSRTAGSFYIGVNAGSPAAVIRLSPDISKPGTYTFDLQNPADPADFVIAKDSAFVGVIDNVSFKIKSAAYRIPEAPVASDSMFVDQRGIITLVATFQVDGKFNPNCIRSSGVNNERQWVPDTNNVASEYILTKGGRAVAGMASRNGIAVWTDDALFTGSYVGQAGNAYNITLTGTGCGLIAPLAAAEHAGFVFWLSPTGQFHSVAYDFQGTRPVPIECSGRRTVFDSIAASQAGKIYAVANTENNEIWWAYPDQGADGTNVEINRATIFSIDNLVWAFTPLDRTAAVKSGVFQYPIMVSSGGLIYYHEKGETADGGSLASSITTAPFAVGDGERLMSFLRFIPDFKDQVGPISFTLSGQDHPRSPSFTRPAQTITPTTEVIDDRVDARRLWFTISANAAPSKWRFGGLHVDAKPRKAAR
jgi:hypothetical protein